GGGSRFEEHPSTCADDGDAGDRPAREHGATVQVLLRQPVAGRTVSSARDFFHRRKYVLIVRIGPIAVPADERTRLGPAEPKWWMNSVDCDWKIDVPLLRAACLVLDECAFGPHRPFAPYHDDAFCS